VSFSSFTNPLSSLNITFAFGYKMWFFWYALKRAIPYDIDFFKEFNLAVDFGFCFVLLGLCSEGESRDTYAIS